MFENCLKIDRKMWNTRNTRKEKICKKWKSRERQKKHFGNMHKISLNVANVLYISHIVAGRFFFSCFSALIHVYVCNSCVFVHLTPFLPNAFLENHYKFSGETLNINLLSLVFAWLLRLHNYIFSFHLCWLLNALGGTRHCNHFIRL